MRRKAGAIYGVIVTQARQPDFYAVLGVPDTPSGRYEMVMLHLILVLERLRTLSPETSPLPRLLVEAFIADMDDSLRELATGDLAVPRKVRKAATGLYERTMAYREGLARADVSALSETFTEHVYGGTQHPGAETLARYLQDSSAALAAIDEEGKLADRGVFAPVPDRGGELA
jgi:cytochrome b pre-mRNA-processing protein 3